MPRDGFWINDDALRFIQLQVLDASGFRDFSLPWSGRPHDPELRFAPVRPPFSRIIAGRLYASYSPVFAMLSVVPFRMLGFAGLYLIPQAGTLLALFAARRLANRICPDPHLRAHAGSLAVIVVALATPLWFYTQTFWEHTAAVGLASTSLLACLHYVDRPGRSRALAVGFLSALPIYLRPDFYLFAGVVALVALARRPWRWHDGVALLAALAATALPLWVFHWAITGSPLGAHLAAQGWQDLDPSGYLAQRPNSARNLLLNAHGDPWISLAIASPFLACAILGPRLTGRRFRVAVPLAGALACAAGIAALYGHLASDQPMLWLVSANGLFAVSPFLIFGFIPAPADAGESEEAAARVAAAGRARTTVLRVLFLHVGLYAALVPELNSAGMHWGCRFLLIAYPITGAVAAVTCAVAWQRLRGSGPARATIAAALLLSVATQLYSLDLLFARKRFSAELAAIVAAEPGDFLVTDVWFLPQDLARVFFDRPIFLVRNRRQLAQLLERLERSESASILLISPVSRYPTGRLVSDGLGHVSLNLRVWTVRELRRLVGTAPE